MDADALRQEIKIKLISYLNLAPMTPDEIKNDEPLFREGLGLDSIDSLELIVMLKREYGINIKDPKDGRKILQDINTMTKYVEEHRTI